MDKERVIEFFGGLDETASAMEYTASNVRQWPQILPVKIQDRVIGRGLKKFGLAKTKRAWPAAFERAGA